MDKPFDDPDLNDIASFLLTGKAGDEIFHEGDVGTEMYIVRQGQIDLVWPSPDSLRQTAIRLQAGEFFGEESLYDHGGRPVSARAVTDYQLIRLDANVFERLVNEDPKIGVQMIRILLRHASRLVDVHREMAECADAKAQTRRVSRASRHEQPGLGESLNSRARPREPVLVDPATGRVFPIAGDGELTVGRVSRSSPVKPAIDLSELDAERTLSRHHAQLLSQDGEVYLRAVSEARNGTFVNGRRLGVKQVRLNEGDRVSFGLVQTVFRYR